MPKQVGSAWAKVFRLSLPNRGAAKAAAQAPRPVSGRKQPATRWQRPAAADKTPATVGS
jgi:hypothetical protein